MCMWWRPSPRSCCGSWTCWWVWAHTWRGMTSGTSFGATGWTRSLTRGNLKPWKPNPMLQHQPLSHSSLLWLRLVWHQGERHWRRVCPRACRDVSYGVWSVEPFECALKQLYLGCCRKLGSKVRISGLEPPYAPFISRWNNPFTNHWF